jgi:hypothetical protein
MAGLLRVGVIVVTMSHGLLMRIFALSNFPPLVDPNLNAAASMQQQKA